jgi:flagellar hook-associated protein 2
MANLQNVETPWKDQISTIGSQDTVLSSLGTLLSNLSTDMSSLTNASGILSEKTGSSSNTDVLTLTAASNSAIAGTHTVEVSSLAATSSGYLSEITNSSDTLSGSIVIQLGSGTAQTVTLSSSDNTLSGLSSAINSAGLGVTASVLTDASGSRLSLVSGTSGTNGNISVTSAIKDTASTALSFSDNGYTSSTADSGTLGSVSGSGSTLSGKVVIQVGTGTAQTFSMTSSDNTLTGLQSAITTANMGVTASIITNSDGTQSISLTSGATGSAGALTVNSNLTDNSPKTLGYVNTVAGANASLTVDGVALTTSSNTVSDLIPGVTFQLLSSSSAAVQVVIGNYNSGVESTLNSMVTDYNSLISAINGQEGNTSAGNAEPLYGSPTLTMLQQDILGGISATNPSGYVDSVSSTNTTLTGSLVIQVGTGTAQTITMSSSDNNLTELASAINAKNMGVTAAVVTKSGESTLTLASQTAGTSGALKVTSALVAKNPTALSYTQGSSTSGSIGSIPSSGVNDQLSGSLVIQFASGSAQTITLSSSDNTLSGLEGAINNAGIGVSASIVTSSGKSSIALTATDTTDGSLSVTSAVIDSTSATSTKLSYNASSDINSLTTLGISVNSNGTLSLDVTALDSILNSDYSGVQGLFQDANSWGTTFTTMLENAGSSSSTGMISLAENANSSIESTLNADISREDALISSEAKSLTTELNSANEVLQEIPSQLSSVNELYSAITGYNQSS